MTALIIFIVLAGLQFLFLGAIYGRLDGGGIAKSPNWLERTLVMSAFIMACCLFAGLYGFAAYAGVLGIATGHGLYFLSRAVKAAEPEGTDFIVRLFFGRDPRTADKWKDYRGEGWQHATPIIIQQLTREMETYGMRRLYWRCVFGMFITGLIVGLPAAGLALWFHQYLAAGLFLLTGPVKALSYIIGEAVFKDTAPAEYINGGSRNAICFAVILICFFIGVQA